MKSIETLIAEHDCILRFNQVARCACLGLIEGKDLCVSDFRDMIDFVRNFADKHHHGKEEKILFGEMIEHLGQIGKNLITHGMLVEHDLARLYISELATALDQYEAAGGAGPNDAGGTDGANDTNKAKNEALLDVITNMVGYTKLLKRHIDKENAVVYTYAEKHLPEAALAGADASMEMIEKQAETEGIQKKYLSVLSRLEQKYQLDTL